MPVLSCRPRGDDPGVCCREEEDRIEKIDVFKELEACIEKLKKKYASDVRTLVVYLTEGYQGVGGVLVYRTLQDRYPDEYEELREITKAALVAEEPSDYEFVPESYTLDKSDPDIFVLRRKDGTFVAAFSASGISVQGLLDAVRQDEERRRG